MTDIPFLSLAIWLPIFGGMLTLASGSDRNASVARFIALVSAVGGLAVSIPLYTHFDKTLRTASN